MTSEEKEVFLIMRGWKPFGEAWHFEEPPGNVLTMYLNKETPTQWFETPTQWFRLDEAYDYEMGTLCKKVTWNYR